MRRHNSGTGQPSCRAAREPPPPGTRRCECSHSSSRILPDGLDHPSLTPAMQALAMSVPANTGEQRDHHRPGNPGGSNMDVRRRHGAVDPRPAQVEADLTLALVEGDERRPGGVKTPGPGTYAAPVSVVENGRPGQREPWPAWRPCRGWRRGTGRAVAWRPPWWRDPDRVVSLLGSVPGRVPVLVAESARAARRARRRHREPGAGADASGLPQAGPPDDGRSVAAAGMETLESGRGGSNQAEHTTDSRQSTSRLAARFPSAACRELSSIGRPRPPRKFRSQAAESKIVAVRRVPAVRVESLDWTLVGGRRQLLRLLCFDVRSCASQRSHAGVGRSRGAGQGRGRGLHRRGQPPRCTRRPHSRGSRRTA